MLEAIDKLVWAKQDTCYYIDYIPHNPESPAYLELEEFDQRLMALEIEKEGDTSGSQNCRLDTQYVERFCRIIENR